MKTKILEKLPISFLPFSQHLMTGKYAKMMQSSSFNNCGHRYNFEILNLFNPELQLINTKPKIKTNQNNC